MGVMDQLQSRIQQYSKAGINGNGQDNKLSFTIYAEGDDETRWPDQPPTEGNVIEQERSVELGDSAVTFVKKRASIKLQWSYCMRLCAPLEG